MGIIFLAEGLQRGQIMLESLGNRPVWGCPVFTCPVNGQKMEKEAPCLAWRPQRVSLKGRQCLLYLVSLSSMQINQIKQAALRINEPEILKLHVRGFLLD